jgi:hypothetical protein
MSWTRAVAAMRASSIRSADFRYISCPHRRKITPSAGKMLCVVVRASIQPSIASAFVGSCLRVISTPACSSPSVTAERNGRDGGDPPDDSCVRSQTAQFQDDVCVEEVHLTDAAIRSPMAHVGAIDRAGEPEAHLGTAARAQVTALSSSVVRPAPVGAILLSARGRRLQPRAS